MKDFLPRLAAAPLSALAFGILFAWSLYTTILEAREPNVYDFVFLILGAAAAWIYQHVLLMLRLPEWMERAKRGAAR
ncbi:MULTISPECIES: hypothetical protein [Paenibacillus]|uniref:hypothetical protein n=1 Tax=Paenibacillus TaxID=44249 RepID=UPI00038F65C3|nr:MULTISPECIES: hypothetical protein [Paenibacillus]CDN45628.1 hypothetical protein BN871_IH_00130 [Paenibacillus sp. P22]